MKRLIGVISIIFVGLVWLFVVLTSPIGWYRLLVTFFAQPFPKLRDYAFDQWVASDHDMNAFFGGEPGTTISGRVGYHAAQGRTGYIAAEYLIDALFYLAVRQTGHCRASIEPGAVY